MPIHTRTKKCGDLGCLRCPIIQQAPQQPNWNPTFWFVHGLFWHTPPSNTQTQFYLLLLLPMLSPINPLHSLLSDPKPKSKVKGKDIKMKVSLVYNKIRQKQTLCIQNSHNPRCNSIRTAQINLKSILYSDRCLAQTSFINLRKHQEKFICEMFGIIRTNLEISRISSVWCRNQIIEMVQIQIQLLNQDLKTLPGILKHIRKNSCDKVRCKKQTTLQSSQCSHTCESFKGRKANYCNWITQRKLVSLEVKKLHKDWHSVEAGVFFSEPLFY